jgi:hypothetical protein
MQNLTFTDRLPSGRSWTEEIPPGSMQRSSRSFTADSSAVVLNIKMEGTDINLRTAIPYILGYSEIRTILGNQVPFNPNDPSAQGPYFLHRKLPATHPSFPNLRATKILSATGGGLRHGPGTGPGTGKIPVNQGTTGEYQFIWMSIQFEVPPYPILDDGPVSFGNGAQNPEYTRHTLWEFEENIETLSRRGVIWSFTNPTARAVNKYFNGDRLFRTPKGVLKVTTYDVAMDYIYLGRLIPVNDLRRTSTLNSRAFPKVAYRDQNQGAAVLANCPVAQFPAGTLLKLPTVFKQRSMMHKDVISNFVIPESYFPRTVDIERRFSYYGPATDETLTIDLSGNDQYGKPYNGSGLTPVVGHELCPLPFPGTTRRIHYAPINTPIWPDGGTNGVFAPGAVVWWNGTNYQAINATADMPPSANWLSLGPLTDGQLLYPYSDFEALWNPVESNT